MCSTDVKTSSGNHQPTLLKHFGNMPRRLTLLLFVLYLQLNDVDLGNRLTQISNSTTRLKGANDLSQLEASSSDNDVKKTNALSSHKKLILFSQWSSWSECDRKCRQKRSRKCVSRRKCGSIKQTEERDCPGYP